MKKQEVLNNVERGDIANCIALHDFSIEKPDLKKWTECVVNFFRKYNIEPSKISSPSRTNDKLIGFKRGLLNHEKINYEVNDIWIGALPLNYYIEIFDKIFEAEIDIEQKYNSFTSITFDSKIVKFTDKNINTITSDLVALTGARYGYIYQREFSKVVGYECGAISGDISDEEEDLVDKWRKVYYSGGSYKTGDMRDIYPMNIVSKAHLGREVFEDRTLEQWIISSKQHGALEKLCTDRWVWHVPQESISLVREALRSTGILLCI